MKMQRDLITIVTGSPAQVPESAAKQLGIKVLPFNIQMKGRFYLDNVDITPSEVYQAMRNSNVLPTTAAPSIGEYHQIFQSLLKNGIGKIIYVAVANKLSGDYAIAESVAKEIKSGNKECEISIFDSSIGAVPQGFLAMGAAEKAKRGDPIGDILQWLEQAKNRVGFVMSLDSLDYLARGGRIGKASHFLGSILHIHPLLSLNDGVVVPVSIQRNSNKILPAMVNVLKERVKNHKILRLAIFHADASERAIALKELVREELYQDEILICEFTPVMGVHTGPGTIGIGYYFE